MGLVDYSESSDSDDNDAAKPMSKKRKLSADRNSALPPLPAAFRDLYSSTVRTSTQDDPALHAGRKRVTPHVAGNWPTHVYLDWTPATAECTMLQHVVSHVQTSADPKHGVHSLLENDRGVQQPLHVSLSRPLSLKTADKDVFPRDLDTMITGSPITTFAVQPLDLVWHPNEDHTRWFLVVRLQTPPTDELRALLEKCNALATRFVQPLLYDRHSTIQDSDSGGQHAFGTHDSFHISIAWSIHLGRGSKSNSGPVSVHLPSALQKQIETLNITFSEVKVRIGQDVHSIPLQQPRKR